MKNRYLFIPAGVIVITFLLVSSFCDLSIARALFNPDNGFSCFMAGFAAIPVGIALGFIFGSLIKVAINEEYDQNWKNIILYVISVIGLIAGCYFIGDHFTSYHAYNLSKWLNIIFGAISLIPGYLLGYFLYDKMEHKHMLRTYIFIAITVVFLIGLVEGFKIFFPRLRYTSVTILGESYFHPWYLPDFSLNKDFVKFHNLVDNEEIKSFPSGHSNLGLSSAFILMFIPKFFKKFEGKEVYFFYTGFIFFLLVAFSRIFIGAHYLSDTMFAATLAMVVYFIANEIYLRKLI